MIFIIMNLCSILITLYFKFVEKYRNFIGMARPRRKRCVSGMPVIEGFKPVGIPMRELSAVTLLFEEYEAIRLCDYLGLKQEDAAVRMNVSRPTLTRIYEKARKSVATAFAEGKAILIAGGDYQTDGEWHRCPRCRRAVSGSEISSACKQCEPEEPDQSK
jgi:predicted DNA-binding protein (UPF0251 family)